MIQTAQNRVPLSRALYTTPEFAFLHQIQHKCETPKEGI